MPIINSIMEKAVAYDKNGLVKIEIDNALVSLKDFRSKFPFTENPESIDKLMPDKVFKFNPDAVGEFFQYLVGSLNPLGHLRIRDSNIFANIRMQIDDFKDLLHVVVNKKKSLAQKVDAPWEKIRGLGQERQIASKIIFCFNYESGNVLPIFSTVHLRHFVSRIIDNPNRQAKYYSLGEEYEFYTSELLRAKDKLPITQPWEITYFARFLYNSYPPPDRESTPTNVAGERKSGNIETHEQLKLREFVKLLGELQTKGKITGQQFRENRELWMQQQPNDRDVLAWRLKQLLNIEPKTNPDSPRNQPLQKHRKL